MEAGVIREIASTVNTLEYTSSPWNQLLPGEEQFAVCARESMVFTAVEEKMGYECILAEEDAASLSHRNAPDVGVLRSRWEEQGQEGPGGGSVVKYLLVMGNEYGDKKTYDTRPRPQEVTHMRLASSIVTRVTPEAAERLENQNEQFTDIVCKLLRLVHPFIYQ